MAEISLAEYAKIRGISRAGIARAVESGRLKACIRVIQKPGVRDKTVITDVALANREWDVNTSSKHKPKILGDDLMAQASAYLGVDAPAIKLVLPREQAAPNPRPTRAGAEKHPVSRPPQFDPDNPEDPAAIDPMTGVPKRIVSQARKEYFDAMHAQAKAELLAGSQVNREEVTRAAFNAAREVRDALFLIKDRLADELATMTDPNKIAGYLDTEFRNALSKLSGEIVIERPDAS